METSPSRYFLEILDRTGAVRERISLARSPLCAGRAYDNDVLIDDPYVSPVHARLELLADGRLAVSDQGSLNGISRARHGAPEKCILLMPGDDLFLGWTELRYRDRHAEVPEALLDHSRYLALRIFLRSRSLAVILVLCMLILVLDAWSDHSSLLEWGDLFEVPLQVLLGIAVWALVWALVSKLVMHRSWFSSHFGIGTATIGLSLAAEVMMGYAGFILDLTHSMILVSHLVGFVLFAAALTAHLRLASRASSKRLLIIALAISAALQGATIATELHEKTAYSDHPDYTGLLKSPGFVWFGGDDRNDFIDDLDELEVAVDKEVEEDRARRAERRGAGR